MAAIKLFRAIILAVIVLVAYVLLHIYKQVKNHQDIKKLGGYAPKVSTKVPFGQSHVITHWVLLQLTYQALISYIASSGQDSY